MVHRQCVLFCFLPANRLSRFISLAFDCNCSRLCDGKHQRRGLGYRRFPQVITMVCHRVARLSSRTVWQAILLDDRKLPRSSNVNCEHCGASHPDSNTAIVKANKQKISRKLINGPCSTLSSNGSLSNAVV